MAISFKTIVKNSTYNLLGYALPIISALISIPHIIKGVGIERFGFLTISWAILGYFTLFDLGLSRAITFHVSSALAEEKYEKIKGLACTGIYMMLVFGLLGAVLFFLMSKVLVIEFFKTTLQDEFDSALKILSLSIPLVIISTALKGILEAYQQFLKINIIQTFIGVSNFLSPLLVLTFSDSLIFIMVALVIIRLLAFVMYIVFVNRVIPSLFTKPDLQTTYIKVLMSYGNWIFISSFVGPLMVYSDRFFIASLLSVYEVTYYTTPFEIITKVTIISIAISGALFPFLTSTLMRDISKAIRVFDKALRVVYLITFPIMLIVIIFSTPALTIWIDKEFAQKSSEILKWLSIGVFFNCIAFIPLSFIHALKRPDITAKIHLIELPVYFVILIWFIQSLGLKGAAIAWTIRTGLDGLLLFYMTFRLQKETYSVVLKHFVIISMSLLLTLVGLIAFR